MRIEVLVVPGCPHERTAVDRMRRALAEAGLDDAVSVRVVADPAEAERIGFTGSPTVLLDGVDPFAEPGAAPGLTCRLYRTRAGRSGAPTGEQLAGALRAAASGG